MNGGIQPLSTNERHKTEARGERKGIGPAPEVRYGPDNVTRFGASRLTKARLAGGLAPTFAPVACPLRRDERVRRGGWCLDPEPIAPSVSMVLRCCSQQPADQPVRSACS